MFMSYLRKESPVSVLNNNQREVFLYFFLYLFLMIIIKFETQREAYEEMTHLVEQNLFYMKRFCFSSEKNKQIKHFTLYCKNPLINKHVELLVKKQFILLQVRNLIWTQHLGVIPNMPTWPRPINTPTRPRPHHMATPTCLNALTTLPYVNKTVILNSLSSA